MDNPLINTVPNLSERLKGFKITAKEITSNCDVPYYRVKKYVEDPSQENDVRVENEILETIEKLIAEYKKAEEANQKKLNSLLNSEVHPIA